MNKLFKNPYANAACAEIYIVVISSIMNRVGKPDTPDNFFTPIAALSLLVLSAAIMAYLFLGQPIQMYLDGAKKQAVTFFIRTVATFAAITAIALIILSRTA